MNFLSFKLLVVFTIFSFINSYSQSGIVNQKVNFGYRTIDKRSIDVVVVHSTYNTLSEDKYDFDLILQQFRKYRVSSHYIINREGIIYRLVDEKNIAFHAGKSQLPDGRIGVNQYSIGIELINALTDSPTEFQLQSLHTLVTDIKKRYQIKYLLRHSDIAPIRKTDPWNMNWEDFLNRIYSSKILD